MWSTADRNLALRKLLGHAPGSWRVSVSSVFSRVSSSNAAAASANRYDEERRTGGLVTAEVSWSYPDLALCQAAQVRGGR